MNKNLCYLISLEGGGDRYYFLVGKASFNWINSPRPDFSQTSCVQETIPAEVLAECTTLIDPVADITRGSWDNDRALFLMAGFEQYDSVTKLMKACGKHGITIVGEYDGCVY